MKKTRKCEHFTTDESKSRGFSFCQCDGELPDHWTKEEIREIWGLPIDGICEICNRETESFSGDPSKWPIELPYKDGNGKKKMYHISCVVESIENRFLYEWTAPIKFCKPIDDGYSAHKIYKPLEGGDSYMHQFSCPNCDFPTNDSLTFDMKYCWNCGVKLDWSDWEEKK